jgi:rhamnogalacturonyl hydrolase YesR
MAALSRFQDADGCGAKSIDHPGAYAELSATAMIGTSMLTGIRTAGSMQGYQPRVDAAWRAVLTRTGSDGTLLDVLRVDEQAAIAGRLPPSRRSHGRDPRGGAMALLFATDMAGLAK